MGDDGYSVVQVVVVKWDKSFADEWDYRKQGDADLDTFKRGEFFDPKAEKAFQETVQNIFKDDFKDLGFRYCKRKSPLERECDENADKKDKKDYVLLIGKGADLIKRLKQPVTANSLDVVKILDIEADSIKGSNPGEKCTFKAKGEKRVPLRNKEVKFSHTVEMDAGKVYVIHRTGGWVRVATASPQAHVQKKDGIFISI